MENKYMKLALKEAIKAKKQDEVPVGAVIVKNNVIISKAHNQKEKKKNPIKHAEIIAIERACKKLKTWHLDECILYVTLEPCLMCAGAIIQSRIKKVIYATSSDKFGYSKNINQFLNSSEKNNMLEMEQGSYETESRDLLKSFFEQKRK